MDQRIPVVVKNGNFGLISTGLEYVKFIHEKAQKSYSSKTKTTTLI